MSIFFTSVVEHKEAIYYYLYRGIGFHPFSLSFNIPGRYCCTVEECVRFYS